jgi:hypothetical protein
MGPSFAGLLMPCFTVTQAVCASLTARMDVMTNHSPFWGVVIEVEMLATDWTNTLL